MSFCWCTIHVKDLEKSLEFYEKAVDLKVNRRFEARPGVEIAFLGEIETQLELVCNQNEKGYPVSDQISFGFIVESLEVKIMELESLGVDIYKEPFQPNPRLQFMYVKDPDGVSVQFVEMLAK